MCTKTKCSTCGKASWTGCGEHIEEALFGIAENERCQGHGSDAQESNFLNRIFGTK